MISVRPFKFEDTLYLVKWGEYHDPRLLHYNFSYVHSEDLKQWYKSKKKLLRRWIYSICIDDGFDTERVVGYITLKNVSWLFGYGEMGIVLDSNYVGRGIGKIAIKKYLDYVYATFPLKTIILRVAEFNYRAQRCYLAAGFEIADTRFEKYEEQENAQKILDIFPYFEYKLGILYTNYIYMRSVK